MKKDTLRLLITLECNFNCSYCCNNQEQFNSQFEYKTLEELNFSDYDNLCITGGEPFLERDLLGRIITRSTAVEEFFSDGKAIKNIYIYSNGVLISDADVDILRAYSDILRKTFGTKIFLNIGVHSYNQLKEVNERIGVDIPARFMFEESMKEKLFEMYPDRLSKDNTKTYVLNQCDLSNEDWVVLKGE